MASVIMHDCRQMPSWCRAILGTFAAAVSEIRSRGPLIPTSRNPHKSQNANTGTKMREERRKKKISHGDFIFVCLVCGEAPPFREEEKISRRRSFSFQSRIGVRRS